MQIRKLFWLCGLIPVWVFLGSAVSPARAELPPLFEGDLAVCKNVEGAMAAGQSLSQALLSNIQNLFTNDPVALKSIRRTFIHDAITKCGYDSSKVIEAVYLAGLPIELIVESAIAAGVNQNRVTVVLEDLGVERQTIEMASALETGQTAEERVLPPALEIGSGLGQVSPFTP